LVPTGGNMSTDIEKVEIFTEKQVHKLKENFEEWQKKMTDKELIIMERKYRLFIDSDGNTNYSIAIFYLVK
jgi:hypothetical protein